MAYTSQKTRFSSYMNGETPYVKNGNWWIGDSDTGVVARAKDGVSFSGVEEYYYATLATDSNTPAWNKDTWKTSIQDTGFGTKNPSGVTYNKLWNVELVKSTDANGTLIEEPSAVELFLTHNDSRIPAEYISYYCASTTSSTPTGGPTLGSNNNSIAAPTNTNWKISSSFTGSIDESAFLFETTFVKYTEKDENGENQYALLAGPVMIGHNGTNGLSVFITYNHNEDKPNKPTGSGNENGWSTTASTNAIWMSQKIAASASEGEWGDPIKVKGEQGPQGIQGIQGPKGDKGDQGTGVSVKESEEACKEIGDGYISADGNLMILTSQDPREFTNGGQIKGPQGDTTYFHTAYANSADGETDFSTSVYTDKLYIGHYTDTNEQDSDNPSHYKWTKWKGDKGEDAQDFNISASSYVLSADSAGNIKAGSKVTLTAHAMNLDSSKIQWSTNNSTWTNTGSSTYEVTATGTYYARVNGTNFKDSVTIGKTIDGTDGQDGNKPPVTSTVTLYGYGSSYTTTLAEILSSDAYWSTSELYVNDSTRKFIFTFSADKTVTYSSNTDTTGTTTYANQRGLTLIKAYLQGYVDSDGTCDDSKTRQYAEYLKATNNGTIKGMQQVGDALYFNADYINTGTLTVTKGSNVIFSASMTAGEGEVSIAGWTVDNNSIRIGTLGNSGAMWLCRGGTTTSAKIGGSDSISGWSLAIGSTFGVTSAGALYASSLKANGGTIAGWTISNQYGIHANFKVAMVNPSTTDSGLKRTSPIDSTSKTMVFYAHTEDPDGDAGYPNFCVLEDGAMYASYGQIGNWKLSTTGLSYGTGIGYASSFMLTPGGTDYSEAIGGSDKGLNWVMTIGSTFGVTNTGALYATGVKISGTVTASGGSVGVAETSGILKVNASIDVGGTVENTDNNGDESSTSESNKSITYFMKDGADNPLNISSLKWGVANNNFYLGSGGLVFRSDSKFTRDTLYDGCRLTSSALVFTGTGGRTASYYGQNITRFNSSGIQFSACGYENLSSSELGSFLNNSSPTYAPRAYLYFIGVSNVGSSVSKYARVQFEGYKSYWRLCMGGSLGGSIPVCSTYYDFRIEGTSKLVFGNEKTTSCPYIANTASSGTTAKLYGTWQNSSGSPISSDRRLKYDITSFDSRHEVLFDNLQGRTFKYIDGISGRVHFGLVADELLQALEIAGFTTKEVASYCAPETEEDFASIRYSELIALNTWQIQKLKPRMTAAEQEIASLKLEIQQLRAELEALK